VFPAVTEAGPEFVTLRSACTADVTAIFTVAVLLFVFVSLVADATVTVSVMMVPASVPAATLYTTVRVPVEPGGTLGLVHERGALFGQVHVPPPVVTTAADTKLVFAGVGSVRVAVEQLLGPPFVMTCVYVMLLPASTGLGVPAFVTPKSQRVPTPVMTVVVLLPRFGSDVVAVTEEFAVTGPPVVLGGTLTTITMSAEVPEPRFAVSLHTTFPVDPTAGEVQVHPAGASTDSKVVLVGVGSVKLRPAAAAGPLLVMVCV